MITIPIYVVDSAINKSIIGVQLRKVFNFACLGSCLEIWLTYVKNFYQKIANKIEGWKNVKNFFSVGNKDCVFKGLRVLFLFCLLAVLKNLFLFLIKKIQKKKDKNHTKSDTGEYVELYSGA